MPIYSPTGFLDITNATLRTSNTECQNLKIGTGNIYVTSEISPDFEVNLSNVTNLGATSPHTLTLSNVTTAINAASNIITSGNLKIGGLIYTKEWGIRSVDVGNYLYVGRFTELGITEVLIIDQGASLGSTSKYTITRNFDSAPLVNGIDSSSTIDYEWHYRSVSGGTYDLWVSPSAFVQTNIKVTSSTYIPLDEEPSSTGAVACVNGLINMSGNVVANQNLTVSGNTFYTSPVSINVDSNVVTEYTGPHDRPLRKYPEIILPRSAVGAEYNGYRIDRSSEHVVSGSYDGVQDLFNETAIDSGDTWGAGWQGTSGAYSTSTGEHITYVTGGTTQGTGANLSSSSGVPNGEWVSLKSPNAIKLYNIQIRSRNVNEWYEQFPTDFQIWGSNNGTTWSHVKTFTGQAASAQSTLHTFSVNSTIFYNRHALVVTKIPGTASTIVVSTGHGHFSISELRFNAKEEGGGSLDTTLKTVYNVPATTGTQLEVYYDAKGESTVQSPIPDLSPNTNTGAVEGHSPTLDSTDGIDSFKFNGSSQYVTGAHGLTTGSGPVHTISLWLNAVETTNYVYVVQLGQGGTSHQQSAIMFYDNKISHAHWGSGVLSDVTIATNVWYHVVAVFTGGNGSDLSKHKIFINGEDGGIGPFPGSSDGAVVLTGTQVTLGRNNYHGGSPGNYFNGSIANFRVYSKDLNADQIKELYDYQKDYFFGSKSQVTLYKGHLGVGVTEPSGQLELAGDEQLQEYPPRGMAGYETYMEGHGVFTAIVSSVWGTGTTYKGYNIFDKTFNTNWASAGSGSSVDTYNATTGLADTALTPDIFQGVKGSWAKLKLPYTIKPLKVQITPRATTESSPPPRQPKSGIVWGSKDDVYWEQISSFNFSTAADDYFVDVNTDEYYSSLVLQVTATRTDLSGDVDALAIRELRYFGTPGPTTLDKGSLSLTRSLDVPRVSRYDVDTETPRPEKLLVDFDTTVNSSPTDISGKGNYGMFNGAADYSVADKAFDFPNDVNTTNENVKITALRPISASTDIDFSFSLWVKVATASTTGWRCIWEMGDRGPYDHFGLYIPGSNAASNRGPNQFAFETWGQGYIPSGDTVEANRWYHVVGTYDKDTRTKTVYVDGVYKNSSTIGTGAYSSGPANPPLTIGSHLTGEETWAGQVSNFKVYKDATLEPSEVHKLYNIGRTGRSMVISDTAVGIGKAPEAQLDVRGNLGVSGHITNGGPRLEICDDSTHVHGYGTSGKGVKFSHAGIVFDRTWGGYPSIGVFTENIDGTTNQGEFRIHGFDVSYSSYPGPSGETDFAVDVRTDGVWQTGSDRRMKINITTIEEALKKVCSLTGKRYQLVNRNGDINKNTSQNGYNYGLIAQDVEEAGIDEIYKYNEREDDKTENYNSAYSINYDSIIPLLINAIKEQQEEIRDLIERVTALENTETT